MNLLDIEFLKTTKGKIVLAALGLAILVFILIHFLQTFSSDTKGGFQSSSPTTGTGASYSSATSSSTGNDNVSALSNGKYLNPKGAYLDGTYTGTASSDKGILQLKAVVSSGVLNSITFVNLPADMSQSVLKELTDEAIQNQVVEVSPINGYYDISTAFNNALQAAIIQSFKK